MERVVDHPGASVRDFRWNLGCVYRMGPEVDVYGEPVQSSPPKAGTREHIREDDLRWSSLVPLELLGKNQPGTAHPAAKVQDLGRPGAAEEIPEGVDHAAQDPSAPKGMIQTLHDRIAKDRRHPMLLVQFK
jgi:hypothetical protein